MTPRDVVVLCQKRDGFTQRELAERLGVSQGTIASTLAREDGNTMRLDNFVKWLDVMDCDLVVVPRYSADPDEEYLLDCETEDVDYERFRLTRTQRRENLDAKRRGV